MPYTPPPVDLSDLSAAEKLAAANPTAAAIPPAPNAIVARTAFLVIIGHDGSMQVHPDVNTPLVLDRQPTLPEVEGACSVVLSDILAQKTSASVQGGLTAMGRQVAEAEETARIRRKLAEKAERPR